MAPKPKSSTNPTSAASNTRSGGNEKIIEKAKNKAEIKEILKPGKLDKAHDIGRGIILGKGGYTAGINTYAIVKDAKAAIQKVKGLQQDLSKTEKEISMKGMSKQQKLVEGERRSELTPEEYAEFIYGDKKTLQEDISDAMKKLRGIEKKAPKIVGAVKKNLKGK